MIGTIRVVLRHIQGVHRITWRDVLGGIALGLPNFFTIYLILSLLHLGFNGSVLYPVLNILVLALSAVTGLVLFRERLSRINMIGISLAFVAILLISIGEYIAHS